MKFKLDENLGRRGQELLIEAGHDATTVRDQRLAGVSDETLFAVCLAEGRALITLDHDFGHIIRFPPERGPGIVILETGSRLTLQTLLQCLRDLLVVLETNELAGSLWILEPGRVRIRQMRDGSC